MTNHFNFIVSGAQISVSVTHNDHVPISFWSERKHLIIACHIVYMFPRSIGFPKNLEHFVSFKTYSCKRKRYENDFDNKCDPTSAQSQTLIDLINLVSSGTEQNN